MNLQTLALNPPHPLSVSLQGRGGPLLITSVAHAYAPLIPALRLLHGVPHILHSNMPATIDKISDLPLQRGGPCIQTSDVNHPPPISALLLQRDMIPIHPSAVHDAAADPPPTLYI